MNQRRTDRGRPFGANRNDQIEIDYTPMISLNDFAYELIEILSSLSNYEIQIQTGKKRLNENENQKRDERAKLRKNILKKQKQLAKAENIQTKQFFLLDWAKTNYEFLLIDKKLILQVERTDEEKEIFEQVKQSANSDQERQQFYHGLYLVFEQINYEMQRFLLAMIKTYSELDSDTKTFENFLQLFQQNNDLNEFTELQKWNKLYQLAYNQKIMVEIEEQEFIADQFNIQKNNINGRIMQKRIKIIMKAQQQIDMKLEFQDQENSPILYLLKKIFNCFQTHYKEII